MSASFRGLVPLLILAIAAHNFEEWLTFPQFGELGAVMGKRLGFDIKPQPWAVVQVGLVFVTLVPAALLVMAGRARKSWGAWVICWIASIFLANVFIPHLPAMLMLGGYAPGGVTAIGINLPLTVLMLVKARQEGLLTVPQIVGILVVGIVSLPLSIAVAFAVARFFVA